MTKTLKKIFLFTFFGALIFSFLNCEYEERNQTNEILQEKIFKIKRLKFDDISKNDQLINKLNKLNKNKKNTLDENGKIVFSDEYDFYIDTNYAVYIEDENGKFSYTFNVYRNNSPYLLENIVLSSIDSSGYELHFAQYNINQQELNQLKNGEAINLADKTVFFNITDNSFITNLFNKTIIIQEGEGDCIISSYYSAGSACGCDGHSYGEHCTCPRPPTPSAWINVWGDCGGGDSSGGNSGDGGTNGGGSPNPNEPVSTTPVVEAFEDEESCDLINKLQLDTDFKARMFNLVYAANNYSMEVCTVLTNNPDPHPTNNFTYSGPFSGDPYNPSMTYNADTNMVGLIHSHYSGLLSIFTAGDLQDLYINLKNYPAITDNIFLAVVTASNTAYLLQIKDRTAFIAFGDKYLSNDDDLRYFMTDIMYEKYKISPNASNKTNEDGFLKMMDKLNMGVSLASANFPTLSTPTSAVFDSWTKKKWDKKTGTVKTSKCI